MLVQQIILVQFMPILSIFSMVVCVEIDIIMAKPYTLKKVYLKKFVQNSVCCNMGKIVFALRGYGGRLFQAKNGIKELIYWKKYLIEGSQHPLKPFSGSNQIWATTSDKKDTSQRPQLSPNSREREAEFQGLYIFSSLLQSFFYLAQWFLEIDSFLTYIFWTYLCSNMIVWFGASLPI